MCIRDSNNNHHNNNNLRGHSPSSLCSGGAVGGAIKVGCGAGSPVGGGAEALPNKRPTTGSGVKRRGGAAAGGGVQVVAAAAAACSQQGGGGYSSDGDSDEE